MFWRLISTVLLVTLLSHHSVAAPRTLSCMSYLEDDKSLQYEDDIDEYPSSTVLPNSVEGMSLSDSGTVSHRRICQPDYTFCFALWRQMGDGTEHIEKQGCWKESTERNAICSQSACSSSTPTARNTTLYYCCCSGDVCNMHFSVVAPPPVQIIIPEASNLGSNQRSGRYNMSRALLLWCSPFILGIVVTVLLTIFYCRRVRDKRVPEEAPLAPSGPGYSSNLRNVDNINLVAMLGSGKYGMVMKGLLHDREVAVKIYPEAHHQYYINERNIYSLPLMDSPALLNYFGYDERHTMDGRIEYQLVLSLAPLGCLQDWLIGNIMDFDTFCAMVKSITRGLSHLHTELRRGEEVKPCIAHRDLNSRNILIKADFRCCISDFGFALKVFGSKYEYKGEVAMAETKSINEVGTLRYMAPELLEGAVNLRDCETSLKQMDVYALGLVLWEVATRCADFYSPAQLTPPYKAPYELEVGAHPTFDQMQALVVRHKARPLFPAGWGGGAAAKLVKDTCEDCWDHDAEARLTSLCAEERMQEMSGLRPRLYGNTQATSPLLSAHNLISHGSSDQLTSCCPEVEPDAEALFNAPPNQQLPPEKNHFIYPQPQLHPYQGRNPCLERNLAPTNAHLPQVLVERSKKHSFQPSGESSFSCLEDDVSVEELLSSGGSSSTKKFAVSSGAISGLGQGFPKQQNTEKKLRGWHGVRALIQKKLFKKDCGFIEDITPAHIGYGDEKLYLVDNRFVTANMVKAQQSLVCCGGDFVSAPSKSETVSFIDDAGQQQRTTTTLANGLYQSQRRPNNLALSPVSAAVAAAALAESQQKSNLIPCIIEENTAPDVAAVRDSELEAVLIRSENYIGTSLHIVPRSLSASVIKNNNNNSIYKSELKRFSANGMPIVDTAQQFRRQRSLEVFHEVFSGRGSTDKLRDPSQRVKTPGDVPPSVRRVRASKTLSLYDDRMMTASLSNHNHL